MTALRSGVPTLESRVFSDVPQGEPFPYAVVSSSARPFAANDFSGQQHTLRVQTFSREDSKRQVLQLQAAITALLDRQEQNLSLEAGTLIKCEYAMTDQPFKEDDGKTWQSVCEFTVETV